jgi:hypothetical protein
VRTPPPRRTEDDDRDAAARPRRRGATGEGARAREEDADDAPCSIQVVARRALGARVETTPRPDDDADSSSVSRSPMPPVDE